MENKKVGRPIEKLNRTKIGLSIDGVTNERLIKLTKMTGRTKSKIVEEAIFILYQKELEVQKKLAELDKQSNGTSYKKLTEMLHKSKR